MRIFLNYSLAIFLLSSLAVNAQTDINISHKSFKTTKAGFDEAWKHILAGDTYYSKKGIWYNDAYNEYLQALVYNNSNAEVNYKTGVSALFSDKKEEAAGFLLKAIELKKDVAADVLFLAGRSLQYAGRYNEAIEKFTSYLSLSGKKIQENIPVARECILECNSAILITKDTLRVSIENLGPEINSPEDDYSEVLTRDGKTMYYASRRQLPESGSRQSDTKFDENILVSHFNNGNWIPAVSAGKNLTTKYCEAPLFINSTSDILYVYTGYSGDGDIKIALFKKGIWNKPEDLSFNIDTKGSETSFTISPSGNEIFYVSDNKNNNIGGKDIFFIKKLNPTKWSKPQNAGRLLNTIYDEESVRFSATGDSLWFSSKGHNSIGGFDIFYSIRTKNGTWDTVKNAGYPVNSPWDELFYYPSPVADSSFYFVSNRAGGLGGLDIYHGQILPKVVAVMRPVPKSDSVVVKQVATAPVIIAIQPEQSVYLVGKVKNMDTGEPVLAKIDLKDLATGEVLETTASSDIDGSYKLKLPGKKSYMIDLRATGFLSDIRRIDVPENWTKATYNLNIELIKVKVGKKVVLNNILFETGKSILTKGSYSELDRLLGIMTENANMKIEISGHTDKTGSEPLNSKLSEARAKTVVDYLVNKGVDRTRLYFKGYGSSQPIADNATTSGRAKNRRVEFKILEF